MKSLDNVEFTDKHFWWYEELESNPKDRYRS